MKRKSYKAVPPFFYTIVKKYLLTLLFVVATSNITLAGPYIKTLNEDIPTLSSGFLPNISGGAIEVRSTDDTYTFMSPFILYKDVENKILAVNGINEDGIMMLVFKMCQQINTVSFIKAYILEMN